MNAGVEQGDGTGANVGAGDRLIAYRQALPGEALFPQLLNQIGGALRVVCVGNADLAVLVSTEFGVFLCQLLQLVLPASHFAAEDDMSAVIPLQDGLDVQHTADYSRCTGDSPALAEIFQVVHRKVLAHIGPHII